MHPAQDSSEASIGADTFFAQAAGKNVSLKGTMNGSVFLAREVEIDND